MLVVSADQEDELRAFCNLVSRRAPQGNEIAWALRRFELGCERASEYEGLSDHVLALRVLLGAPRSSSRRALPMGCSPGAWRLCATPEQRSGRSRAHARGPRAGARQRSRARPSSARVAWPSRASSPTTCARFCATSSVATSPPDLAPLADELLLSGEEVEEDSQRSRSRAPGGTSCGRVPQAKSRSAIAASPLRSCTSPSR